MTTTRIDEEAEVALLPTALVDRFGRVHRDLRVSLTDRCNLRCRYCMPADGMPWLASNTLLTSAELVHLVGVAASLGVNQVRLTGGEPLLRPDVVDVVSGLTALPSAPRLSLTTNALRLHALAQPLADAGLQRVNVSLDSLDRDVFARLTLRDRLVDTLAGIAAASAAGFEPIKINAVIMREVNDHEPPALLRWAADHGYQMRFIEQMPLDPQHGWTRDGMITRAEIVASLEAAGCVLTPRDGRGAAPAELFDVVGPGVPSGTTVGIVASVTAPFCTACDRVRLTADGQWRSCLFAKTETDLRTPLRAGATRDDVARLMAADTREKWAGHGVNAPGFVQPGRGMSAIGG